MQYHSLGNKLLASPFFIFLICLVISFITFSNTLQHEFAVIDDLPGYIENQAIRNIPESLSTFKLQEFVYSINYHFFQLDSTPLRILAVINHAIVATLLFYILKHIGKSTIRFIATILFLVHPVTTESINWVSAQFYIVMAIFLFTSLLYLIQYRNTSRTTYIYFLIGILLIEMITIRHAWVFVVPFVVMTFDYFFLEKKPTQIFYKTYISFLIPLIVFFIIFNFSGQFTQRMLSRNETGKTLQNQQALTPVIQGYPYTIYSMLRLYMYPKDLTIYYDGAKITSTTQFMMYSAFLLYSASIIYFYKKNKKIAGLLILLLVFILPLLSPKKITWFIAERYLYAGTGFFTFGLVLLLSDLEKKLKIKHLTAICALIIFCLYGFKTYQRNKEWKNPETLAFATIKTSPYSVRPYNDLAGYYVLKNNLNDAKIYYVKALEVSSSLTAVRNLGHIYMEDSFDPSIQTIQYPTEQIYNEALRMIQTQEYYAAAYYLNEILAQDSQHVNTYNRIAELYVMYGQPNKAKKYLETIEQDELTNADTYYIYAYIAYSEQNYVVAREYINRVLIIDPSHAAANQLLQQLPVN